MRLSLLDGIRVLEVGESVAVAFCGKILAELGAEVLMVEPPGGSALRRLPPYYQDIPGSGRSVLHNWLSTSKRSVTLNLDTERGQALLRQLCRGVDILVRTHDRGPGAASLQAVNATLTVITISPFGADGPYAGYRANDLTLFAMSGVSYYLACPVDDPPATPPKRNPGYQVGTVAGLSAANAALWALVAGKRKGRGIAVEVSEWEAFTHLLYEHTGHLSDDTLAVDRKRMPGTVITIVGGLVWCLPCVDGWVLASPREDHQFRQWGEVIEAQEWASQAKFSTPKLREQNAWEIYERSAAWTKLRKTGEVSLAAQDRKVACFPVSQMTDLAGLEQLTHRGFWTEVDHPFMRGLKCPGLPMRVDGATSSPSGPPPSPGEHMLAVCKEMALQSEEVRTLWQLGIM
jgi:crotonobetainyl-CoA:carnitine CoA-transferase CaiB-like acyl-CoA transferase